MDEQVKQFKEDAERMKKLSKEIALLLVNSKATQEEAKAILSCVWDFIEPIPIPLKMKDNCDELITRLF